MENSKTTYKLAIIATHPIQYQTPLFRKIAQISEVDLMVYFCSDFGVKKKKDPGFGVSFKWDIPLLEGYKFKFLKNLSPFVNGNRLWMCFNPGIIKEILMGNYDALLIQGYVSFTNWLAFLLAKIKKIPVLFRGETVLHKESRVKKVIKDIFLKLFFKKIDAFLTIGKRSKEFYLSYGIPEEKMFLTPYSIDNEFFINQREKEKKIFKTEMPVILYVSKMTERKRPQDLLFAFEKLKQKAFLLFVGEGRLRPLLEKYVKEKKISNVVFVGFKNQRELAKYYLSADIFVLPSSYEPWGLVINEAMCFSLPVIATKETSAVDDLVFHGENGFIYKSGDVEKLAQYLDYLLSNPEIRKKMGRKSFQIISNWNYERCLEGLLSALKYVVKK